MTNMHGAVSAELEAMQTGVLAWEPEHHARTCGLLRQVAAGTLSADLLRAQMGGASPSRSVSAGKGVAVLALAGPLSPWADLWPTLGVGTSLQAFGHQLRTALADPAVGSILLLVDSPGGLVGMVTETAALVRQARAMKPVYAVVLGMCASAAYWIASNASSISATPSALVGAIGIYTVRASIARQLAAAGIDVDVISAGKYKADGLNVLPLSADDRQATQDRVNETYDLFLADVAAGRRVLKATVKEDFGQGRVVSAASAKRAGMVDRVELFEDTLAQVSAGRVAASAGTAADRQRRLTASARQRLLTDDQADEDDRLRRMRMLLL